MCILSIITKPNGDFILTQNRDESIYRPTSPDIKQRVIYGQTVTGPVDLLSGGTWIYHTEKYVVCVLNGAYEKHAHLPPYRMSRGLLILELLKYDSIQKFIEEINLYEIEPFTMVMIDLINNLKQILVWDGIQKFTENNNEDELIVRSSSTLYDATEKLFHENAFKELGRILPEPIFNLHLELSMPENQKYQGVQSTSITQITYSEKTIHLKFCPIP